MDVEKLSDTKAKTSNRYGDEGDPGPHSHSVTTINHLPVVVLAELFSYLTHTENLISRLVCHKWEDQISSFLIKHSYYSLTSKESLQVVLDSHDAGMQWTKLKICDDNFVLPSKFKNSITTMDVHMPKFRSRLTEYITFLTEFPSLTSLKMSVEGGGPDDIANVESDAQALILNGYLKTIFEKLKSLAITFPFRKFFVLCDFFERISTLSMNLNTLAITEGTRSCSVETEMDRDDSERGSVPFARNLYHTILQTSSALKSLGLHFNSYTIQTLFTIYISWINTSELCKLKLESVLISRTRSLDFLDLQEFLMNQISSKKLNNLILPWCPVASLCQEFVRCLPPDIEFVGNVCDEHITDEFPSTFKKLKSISIQSNLTRQLFIAPDGNVQRFEIDLGTYKSTTFQPQSLYENLANNLKNLSELHFIGNNVLIFDSDLRQIINQLSNHLRVLHLESCKITDFGLLGVREDDVELQELINTKRLYYHQTPNENLFPKVTQPLSYLGKLEKLVLVGTNITDVGIILGFKFGLTLKQLIFSSGSPEVTDFGLYSLGSNNPGLEVFEGSFKSGKISTVGLEKFNKQLPLMEFTRKFKVVNKKPNN